MKRRWVGHHKLVEELGELLQVLGKIAAFPEGDHPDGGPPLLERVQKEMADVQAAITHYRRGNGLDHMSDRYSKKLELFRSYPACDLIKDGTECQLGTPGLPRARQTAGRSARARSRS